jgi:hypothetical protein
MRRLSFASLLLLSSLVATSAAASPGAGPVDALDTREGAMPIDGGAATMPRPFDPGADLQLPPPTQKLGDKILFVNFDGQQMNSCFNNDPQQNCSSIFGGTVLPFSGDVSSRAAIIQTIRGKVEDFGITVTDQRPQSGDYDMEMVGDWQGQSPAFAGIAPGGDCFDQTGGEVSFSLEATGSADGMTEIILQELSHTWGLEHVNDQSDLLYPTTEGQNKTFVDQCFKIVSDTDLNETNGFCNSMHTNFCNAGWQNSHAELLALFGPGIPDTTPPGLAILTPTEGETVQGGDFELLVAIEDNEVPAVINLRIDMTSEVLTEPVSFSGAWAAPNEVGFPINGLPDGTYTISVEADDESDNPAADAVSFTVVGSDAPPVDTGAGSGGDDASADGSGGGADGDGTGGPGGAGDDSGDGTADGGAADGGDGGGDGCGCRAPTSPLPSVWLGLVLPVLLRRRRC